MEELKSLCRPSVTSRQNSNSGNSKTNYLITNISSTSSFLNGKLPEYSLSLINSKKSDSLKRYKEKGVKIKVKNTKESNNSQMEIDDTAESDKKGHS